MKKLFVFLVCMLMNTVSNTESMACTRVVYQGPESTIITARSMDWKDEIPAGIMKFMQVMLWILLIMQVLSSFKDCNGLNEKKVKGDKKCIYGGELSFMPAR